MVLRTDIVFVSSCLFPEGRKTLIVVMKGGRNSNKMTIGPVNAAAIIHAATVIIKALTTEGIPFTFTFRIDKAIDVLKNHRTPNKSHIPEGGNACSIIWNPHAEQAIAEGTAMQVVIKKT